MLSYILPFIALIVVVVFIHEYGHYYFAKRYGVGVTDFSIGFGKEIFGWNDKSGTRWKICLIPLVLVEVQVVSVVVSLSNLGQPDESNSGPRKSQSA